MANNMGKVLLEMKKVGGAFKKSANEIGSAIGEAATNISAHTKAIAKIAMLKAEMDAIYLDLGKSVFEDGLMPDNETAMNLMNVLFEKSDEIEALQKVVDANNAENDKSCDCGADCDCKGDCTCEDSCEDSCDDCVCEEEAASIVEIPTEDDEVVSIEKNTDTEVE